MNIYVNIKPFERLQEILIEDNGETSHHYVFLEDIPATILNDYKHKTPSDSCTIRLIGNNAFNQECERKINECFIKEYGIADYILIKDKGE